MPVWQIDGRVDTDIVTTLRIFVSKNKFVIENKLDITSHGNAAS